MLENLTAARDILITTTAAEVIGRPTSHVHGVVVGEGSTAVEAVAGMEEMAMQYEADAVVEVRVIAHGTLTAHGGAIRYCAYGTAVAVRA